MMKHLDEVLRLLTKQIGNSDEVADIADTAKEVASYWVNPLSSGQNEINGLIYGLIQSGKTGVLTVTGAIAADDGYRTIIILTSDNDPLYLQTFSRAQEAFPGIDILGKNDFKDLDAFLQRIRRGTCAIITTKNAGRLNTLIENFKKGNVPGLSCLIIDDEADQASLNTRASKPQGPRSRINGLISTLRTFFDKTTYLQVTATPQSLFLQAPTHDFRPKFTVLSHPGAAYVGGEDFFGNDQPLIRPAPLADIAALSVGAQPHPTLDIPTSLLHALDAFMVAATYKRMHDPDENCAFLCHVSTAKADHNHIVDLLRKYKSDLADGVAAKSKSTTDRLRAAYDDLCRTDARLKATAFPTLVEALGFFSPGTTVKLVNGDTDEDVAVRTPYNLFVGGNKLGRGVTIKNLLVSYYGRNPSKPQADTVLQHARMYGYRREDIGLLRLFLPPELNTVFKAIHRMEGALRELIETKPGEEFRGIYLEGGLSPTRKNVLVPGAIGVYSGGSIYNPAQVTRDRSVEESTRQIDELVSSCGDKQFVEVPIGRLRAVVSLVMPDQMASERIWNPEAVAESLTSFANLHDQTTGYIYVDRGRRLKETRRETQGILDGGEAALVPAEKVTLFMLRIEGDGAPFPVWWPQIRFPTGRYAFAFAI